MQALCGRRELEDACRALAALAAWESSDTFPRRAPLHLLGTKHSMPTLPARPSDVCGFGRARRVWRGRSQLAFGSVRMALLASALATVAAAQTTTQATVH